MAHIGIDYHPVKDGERSFPDGAEIGNLAHQVSEKEGGHDFPPISTPTLFPELPELSSKKKRVSPTAPAVGIGSSALSYPDYIGYSYNELNLHQKRHSEAISKARKGAIEVAKGLNTGLSPEQKLIPDFKCIVGARAKVCADNHLFYYPVFCGKQSCNECGRINSQSHKRKINDLLPTFLTTCSKGLGYMVITLPELVRRYYMSKKELAELRNYVQRKLKRVGITQACINYHLAGDCPTCKGNKGKGCSDCHYTGCGSEFHPHLNILFPVTDLSIFDYGRCTLKKDFINEFRSNIEEWIYSRCKKKFSRTQIIGNVHYNFVPPVGTAIRTKKGWQKVSEKDFKKRVRHKVRYVTRATLRHPDLVALIEPCFKSFKFQTRIGQWVKKELEPIFCPICEKKGIKNIMQSWYSARGIVLENLKTAVKIAENGYFVPYDVPDLVMLN
jgi:hypothetical protein